MFIPKLDNHYIQQSLKSNTCNTPNAGELCYDSVIKKISSLIDVVLFVLIKTQALNKITPINFLDLLYIPILSLIKVILVTHLKHWMWFTLDYPIIFI